MLVRLSRHSNRLTGAPCLAPGACIATRQYPCASWHDERRLTRTALRAKVSGAACFGRNLFFVALSYFMAFGDVPFFEREAIMNLRQWVPLFVA